MSKKQITLKASYYLLEKEATVLEYWICRRITPQCVLNLAHKTWEEDPKAAGKVALEAYEIIRLGYAENPPFFCGKKAKSIVSGLFFILSLKHDGAKKTQREIAIALDTTEEMIRKSTKRWSETFPNLISEVTKIL